MVGMTLFMLIVMILAALLFSAVGSEITVGISTLLWIIVASFIVGAIWTVMALAGFIGNRVDRLKGR